MKFTKTKFEGCYIIEPTIYKDKRGYFLESFNEDKFNKNLGNKVKFIQDNQSFSKYGVLRGLHYQKGNFAQAKLVRVISGRVLDIVVDIRNDSLTFGQYESFELSSENKKQIYIPRGFAHGFVVLSKSAEFFYKVDNYYEPASEAGIKYNDPDLKIDWQLDYNDLILNDKDLQLPYLKNIVL